MTNKNNEPRPIEDTVECIEALAQIVKNNDLGRIKISTEDIDIVIEGKRCPPPMPAAPVPVMPGIPAAPAAAPAAAAAEKPAEQVSGNIITSPIVGTFYASPSPEKPPFVKVGDTVNTGDVVCIIESMKLMNEINSEFSGRVAEIYAKNGEPVEFGQKLMRIE
ncbi:MAG: acetyl-CoA carboxylase biotin carboxyl carrier protein [Oscillospiraceae bacterium]|nr:acetyl-CoA carboxylase biotin carboxyl carrier protein [Oscillospiraceae bacterium]